MIWKPGLAPARCRPLGSKQTFSFLIYTTWSHATHTCFLYAVGCCLFGNASWEWLYWPAQWPQPDPFTPLSNLDFVAHQKRPPSLSSVEAQFLYSFPWYLNGKMQQSPSVVFTKHWESVTDKNKEKHSFRLNKRRHGDHRPILKMDNVIHWITHCPADSVSCFLIHLIAIYPISSG